MPKAKTRKPTSVHRQEHLVLAQLVRELRIAAGMTQAQTAIALGITQTGISDIESGDRGLDLIVVRDLVGIFGADWFAFIQELETRILAGTKPASALLRKKSSLASKPKK